MRNKNERMTNSKAKVGHSSGKGPSYDPSLVGYVRVSTREQNEEMQIHALIQSGVDPGNIYIDKGISGRAKYKPERELALRQLRAGDTLVVWRLDRVSRSMIDMLTLLRSMEEAGIGLRSLTEYLDTRGAMGKLMIHILSAFAQFESDSGIERTTTGIRRAQANGVKFGQPTKITDDVIDKVNTALAAGEHVPVIAKRLKLAESTIRKYWKGEVLMAARDGKAPDPFAL
jgi:DNA invertase Pin-like site-specific DNA recombinase